MKNDKSRFSGLILDRSYRSVRYSNDYTQPEAVYRALIQWVDGVEQSVRKSAEEAITDYLEAIETETSVPQPAVVDGAAPAEEPGRSGNSSLDQVVQTLREKLPLHALYLLVAQQHREHRHNLLTDDAQDTTERRYLMLAIVQPVQGVETAAHQA